MNTLEHCLCSSSIWRYLTGRQLLPWVLSGVLAGDHVLEIGAGYGAATRQLRQCASRVTSLEYDARMAGKLKNSAIGSEVVRGDGAQLPFASQTFSCVIAILVVHHLRSREQQDRMFADAYRVLRPSGAFLAFEIPNTWLNRAAHFRSTFTPIAPGSAFERLHAAGLDRVSVDYRRGGFRVCAMRP